MRVAPIGIEFAKMRRLRLGLLAGTLAGIVAALTLGTGVASPDFVRESQDSWSTLLGGIGSSLALAAPLLLSVLASRQVDIEHRGSGWLLVATSGVTPGALCRAKVFALGLLVATATVVASVLVLVVGLMLGITAAVPVGRWLGSTLALVVVNLGVLAFQVLLSTHVENQLVSMGVGLLGTFLALFGSSVPSWMAHLTPWGYYALSSAAEYRDADLIAITPAYASIAAMAVVVMLIFGLVTGRLDRQEM